MPWTDLALHVLALLVYPGAVLMLAFGAIAEVGAAVAIDGAGPRAALGSLLALRHHALGVPAPLLTAALLEVLAATQLAIPFSPVSPVERNLLIAAVALAAATWLGWTSGWSPPAARRMLVVHGCWLVALLAPAVVAQTLRPAALGAVIVPSELPLKALSAVLALVCLPALLQLLPDLSPPPAASRLPRWLPFCGLVVSVLAPPAPDDPGGLLRFAAETALVAAVAIGLGALAVRRPQAAERSARLAAPLAAVVLAVAAVTSAVT